MAVDLDQVCRVCLETADETFDIFTSYFSKWKIKYSEIFWKYTSIKPTIEDGLPHQICKSCTKALKRTFTFNLQCEESDSKLKCLQVIPKTDDNTIKEEDLANYETFNDNDSFATEIATSNDHINDILKEESEKLEDNSQTDVNKYEDLEEGALDLTPIQEYREFKNEITELIESVDEALWDADDEVILNNIKATKTNEEKPLTRGMKIIKKSKKIEDADYVPEKKKRGPKKKEKEPVDKPINQCDICGKITTSRGNLKQHIAAHLNLKVFQCDECPKSYKSSSHLTIHRRTHTGEKPYSCEHCGKTFARRTAMVLHIRIHTGEKRFKCEICQKRFTQAGQLSIHMMRHTKEKPHLCQNCGKGFPLKSELVKHERIHTGEKPFPCSECDKHFATLGNLSIHFRTHTRKPKKTCEICNKEFLTTSAYSVHMKRHRNIRNYKCDCGKGFFTAGCLKQHKYTHTGERRFQCKICEKTFGQTSHLGRHFRKYHAKPNVPLPPSSFFKRKLSPSSGKEIEKFKVEFVG